MLRGPTIIKTHNKCSPFNTLSPAYQSRHSVNYSGHAPSGLDCLVSSSVNKCSTQQPPPPPPNPSLALALALAPRLCASASATASPPRPPHPV